MSSDFSYRKLRQIWFEQINKELFWAYPYKTAKVQTKKLNPFIKD